MARPRIDPFIVMILTTVGVATLLPARGVAAGVAGVLTTVAIGLLFFLYGVRLSPAEAMAGLRHWRLHVTVLVSTFVLFPLLGLAARLLVPSVLTPSLYTGVLFLCVLPSTVQSSIAFTSIAKGNVAAAVCAASMSSLLGVFISPVLVGLLVSTNGDALSLRSVGDIVLRLLVPFLLGQVCRRWLSGWVGGHKRIVGVVDRGSILVVVYTAFSEGVVAGIWHELAPLRLVGLVGVDALLLGLALVITWTTASRLGFSREDRITIVFCGSKKSLSAGLPMAAVFFPGTVGLVVLPLMLFHQIQLMVCAALARRWATNERTRSVTVKAAGQGAQTSH
ncbi:MAG TPA: bile acid:sodium symporter family protein [Pseudonocardiaceae bacterium]|jgi:sodium/bile acid cotransporter 7|nr:bile acid:sodium symporter family protein [Pseudonocardiaceae bacterium]